ncbi:hypothetical protein REPUB_Repub13aG0087800 [Reevesia pubescens]
MVDHGDLGIPLTDPTIKAIIMDMFAAGGETTSTTTEWAMSEMLKNARVLNKAQIELIVNSWAIGRDPNCWTEAGNFYPERFLDSSIEFKGANFEFIPFGAGRRICPGMPFGIANIELPLAQLLYHFDWKLYDGRKLEDLDMTEAFGLSVARKYDLCLVPIPYCPMSIE